MSDAAPAVRRVILLHGIWMVGVTMRWFAAQLRKQGFAPEILGYHSIVGGPQAALPHLQNVLRSGGPAHLLGHSLGGLVALEALRRAPDLPVPRVVCLGTPLRGSDTARRLAAHRLAGLILGRSSQALCGGYEAWDGPAELGMIAGTVPHGIGRLLRVCDRDSDGTVRVAETRIPGLADHCTVPASHSGLVLSAEAARQATTFLAHGRFERP
jgi:pimeloyl-ACP methyl ester carboxylesterase